MTFSRSHLVIGGCLVLLTATVYLPALRCGFIWDDDGYVLNNITLRSFGGLPRIWFDPGATQDYYPLTFTSFWIDFRFWKLAPFGYHLENILLHAANAVVLWRLLSRLRVPGALLAAAIFAVHPVHVESVAWITERKNVLSGLLYLLSLHAYVRFARLDAVEEPCGETLPHADTHSRAVSAPDEPTNWRYYFLSLGAFALAMLSKTAVITLPFVLPVIVWWKRGRLRSADFLLAVPYLVVAVPLMLVVFTSDANFGGAGVRIVGKTGSGSTTWDYTLVERGLIAGRAMWFYAGKLVWPTNLAFVYPRWQVETTSWWQIVLALGAVAVPIGLWWRRTVWGRGPLAAVLVFGLSLGPASGFFNFYFQRYSLVADHLQYLASIGLIVLAVAVARAGLTRLRVPWRAQVGAAVGLLLVLGILTWNQCFIYRDLESLWRDTLAKNPGSRMAHVNLGTILLERGANDDALQHFKRALEIDPDFEVANYNMGVYWFRNGQPGLAIASFEKTLRKDPSYASAHDSWGMVLAELGRTEEAHEHYRAAIRVAPDYSPAYFNLAASLHRQGEIDRAARYYESCLEINPFEPAANYNLATLLTEIGQFEKAIPFYEAAIDAEPENAAAHFNLGVIRFEQGHFAEAARHLQATLQSEPNDADAHQYLGMALQASGRFEESRRHLQRAAQLRPE